MIKLASLRVSQLNQLLQNNNATMTGTKAHKVAKLQEILGSDEIDPNELEDEGNDFQTQLNGLKEAMSTLAATISAINSTRTPNNGDMQSNHINEVSTQIPTTTVWGSTNEHQRQQASMSIQDMVGIMPEFDPMKDLSTAPQFITRIEQLRQAYAWREDLVLVAIQHKLKGVAKRWLDSQVVFSRWEQFVNAFERDFPAKCNVAEIHKALMKRKRKSGEDYVEYFYTMLAMGHQGRLDDKSIITYIVSGLNDVAVARNLATMNFLSCSELLVALKNLVAMTGVTVTTPTYNQQIVKTENNKPIGPKCFNCNEQGHIAKKCPRPQRKQRCTVCSKVGHDAKACSQKSSVAKIAEPIGNVETPPVLKSVVVDGKTFEAFVDTGSVSSLISAKAAEGMTSGETYKRFIGFGGSEVEVTRKVEVNACIDDKLFPVTLYIVNDHLLPYDILLGRDVLQNNKYRMIIDGGVLHLEEVSAENFNIPNDLEKGECRKLINLLETFQSSFAEDISHIGKCKDSQMVIEVTTKKPILGKRYQVPFSQRPILSDILKKLLDNGIIRPSNSPHAASVLLVKKSNGENRMCIDYRALNEVTVKKNYIMPIVEEQLSRLAGNMFFSTLDMTSGYYQIPLEEKSKSYTAFLTHEGLYEHNVMPFGLVNAPMVFQETIVNIIKRVPSRNKIINYVDEVIIATKDESEGRMVLREFLEAIEESNLTLRPSKCTFLAKTVNFLGHTIDERGIRPGPEKTKCIREFPTPSSSTTVRQFLGLTGFFRKFVPRYSDIALPLSSLLKKQSTFEWGATQESAFQSLKESISTKPVLTLFDPNRDHEVHTDASSMGVAAVMLQNEADGYKPVFYFSRKCSEAEQKYASHELEVLAIVEALQRFRTYLLGRPFKVVTDCNAVATTKATTPLPPRIARWWLKLQEFAFTCQHRPGSKMSHVDGMSRAPVLPSDNVETVADLVLQVYEKGDDWLGSMQWQDERLREIIKGLRTNEKKKLDEFKHYSLQKGRLYRDVDDQRQLVVPKAIRWRIAKSYHDDAGHFALEKTIQRMQEHFWFPRLRRYVKSYIEACPECCLNKVKGGKSEGQLHVSDEVMPIPFRSLHLDHLGPFPKSKKGNIHILVIVCAFSKYCVLKGVRNTKTTSVVNILKEIFLTYGQPKRVTTDRGTAFTSAEFERFMAENGIQHVKVAVRTPRANGQAERINKTVLASLKCTTKNDREWDVALPTLQWNINAQVNSTTKFSPNQLVFNFNARDVSTNRLIQAIEDDNSVAGDIEFRRQQAYESTKKAKREWKERFDKHHQKPRLYKVGDLVVTEYVPSATGTSHKLDPLFKGPYMVTKVLPHDRYLVEDLPDVARSQRRYCGVLATDGLKPWCALGPEDNEMNSADESSPGDDVSGEAEL